MNIILLSGGSGKRLWPLSNDVRSKQFIKLFQKEDGSYESMIQRMYHGILNVDPKANITIATSKSQVSSIHKQIGDEVHISVEPSKRDTFPAIALAASYMHDVGKIQPDEIVIVVPVDPFVDADYFLMLLTMEKAVLEGKADLTLMGIEPTYPSEKYGYIFPESKGFISSVSGFKEKPQKADAIKYIDDGALWNGGVFAFRLSYVLDKARNLLGAGCYDDILSNYNSLKKISFDYEIVEKEKRIQVIRFDGTWKDLGTWNTFSSAMKDDVIGKGILSETCTEINIINELDIPVVAMGIKNAVIVASPNGILVTDKEQSSYMKPIVEHLEQEVMIADKSWGRYRVIDMDEKCRTIKITLMAGHHMSYHSHDNRDEIWTVTSGSGKTVIDGKRQTIKEGDVITLQAGCRHTVLAETELCMIEVQIGEDISVMDKKKFNLDIFTN